MKKRKVLTFITAITFGLTSMFYTSSYVVADDGTAAVTASEESEGIYFLDKGVMVETGKKCGITLFGYNDDKIYDYEESPIKFTIDDESIAKIIKVHGDIVQVNGINVGTTELRAETPDGQKASVKIAVVEVPPTTTTTAVWTTPNTTTTRIDGITFGSSSIRIENGINGGISLQGYNDGKFYEVGESPIEFTIDDEQIAKITQVQGILVNVMGIAEGETILHAKTPDGKTASVKLIVPKAVVTTTTAVWTNNSTTTTTVSQTEELSFGSPSIRIELDINGGISLQGYNDSKFYEPGESPVKYTIDDESIAKITKVQGYLVNVMGVSTGETTLHAKTPDGRTASVKLIVPDRLINTTTTAHVINTTATTTQTVTSSVIYDFMPTVEIDKSPMVVGETREGRFYNPETKKNENGSVYSASDAISIDYTKGSDTFKITALKAGEASISFNAKGCAFTGYVSLKVIDKIKGDANGDGTVDMSDVVLIMQALANPNKYGENGTAEVHLTAQGKANADMDGNGLTVGDAQKIQMKLLGIE